MKIPEKLNIAGQDYDVKVCNYENENGQKPDSCANHWYHKLVIAIDEDENPKRQETLLLHEIIHAISTIYDLGLTEHQVLLLEAGLYQVLRENDLDFRKEKFYDKPKKRN